MTHKFQWPKIRTLLSDDQQLAAVESSYPENLQLSFLSALEKVDSDKANQIEQIGRRLDVASQLADFPIIAVAGMLNSGKTSLVATFLSQSGRLRSLRGEANREGTHRFVLWLPESWRRDAEVWGLLMSRLAETLGEAPEMLDDEPTKAHQQYNNSAGDADALKIPLVATDPSLDEAAVGLLDCPDIVTSEAFGKGAIASRRELLSRASTLCSAFVIVTDFAAIRANTIGDLLDIAASSMPNVRRYLAINMIRPKYMPHQVQEDLVPLMTAHAIESSFLAYDFEIRGSEQFIPESANCAADDNPLPVFFAPPEDADTQVKNIGNDKLLLSLPKTLNRSDLFEAFRHSQEVSLARSIWSDGVDVLRSDISEQADRARRTRQTLCDVSLEFFGRRGTDGEITELRLHQTQKIISQLTEAFSQAAPWYARLGMKMNGFFARFTHTASGLIQKLTPTAVARDKAMEIRDKFRRGSQGSVLSGQRLCEALIHHDLAGQMRISINREDLLQQCDHIVQRFGDEDKTALDEQQLTATAEQMWQELSIAKKLQHGLTPVAALFASFAAVLMVPIDAGGTFILQASIAEILLATGFTGLVTAWNSQGALKSMELQAARQQLSDLVAIECDTFGVPRAGVQSHDVPSITVAGPIIRAYRGKGHSAACGRNANPHLATETRIRERTAQTCPSRLKGFD